MDRVADVLLDDHGSTSGRQQPSGPAEHEPADAAAEELEASVEIADVVIRLVRTWSQLKARMVSTVDAEVGTLFVLGRLVKAGPTRAKDLAEATCADQSTISRQVAGLVKAGLVERQADPDDGRASILVPTALGVSRVNEHFANGGRALQPLLADWSAHERQEFVDLLRRFTTNLELRRDEVAKVLTVSHPQASSPVPSARSAPPVEHVHPHASTERFN